MRARWRYWAGTGEWMLAEWTPAGEPTEVLGAAGASSLTAIAPQLRARVAEAMLEQHGIQPPAEVFDGPPGEEITMTCPVCWHVSWDAGDARARRCARAGDHPVGPVVPAQRAGEPGPVHSGQSS